MDPGMTPRNCTLLFVLATVVAAQKYDGPRPPKADLPYLKHGASLLATEVAEAKEENRKDDVL